MAYQVKCVCGKSHPVTAGDAGTTLMCACQRVVQVPALNKLRADSGETPSHLDRLRGLLLTGQLPSTKDCASCSHPATGMVQVEILCDRVRGTRDPCHADFAGFLLAAVGGLFFDLLFTGLRDRRVKYGDEVSILVPLPVCEVCREMLNGINLRQAVLQIPEYAELLDHYPNAEITRRG